MFSIVRTQEFLDWYRTQRAKIQAQVDARLDRIQLSGHLGHTKRLSPVLFEIKFNNGNRIYCTEALINGRSIVLILGGNKHGQDKDIRKAQKIAEKIHGC